MLEPPEVTTADEDPTRVGSISLSKRRMIVDLPDPEAPTTKTKSPFSITNETSLRATTSGS